MGTRSTQIPDGPSEFEAWYRVFCTVLDDGYRAGFLVSHMADLTRPEGDA